ncbi:MAG: LysE family transporter [Crocinitomicaceae bacterium]|nr:LysE family translocator [Flavobacteriales bacterium]NQZ34823.1 LysE family transporter [Crocinitomicaceae bacterium]
MDLLLKGLVTGFILSIMIGPVFFVLLETSIRKGVKAALWMDLGVLISDLVYILIAYVFFNEVEELSDGGDTSVFRFVGGLLFIVYGVFNFFKKVTEHKYTEDSIPTSSTRDYIFLGLKGFLLNIANPLVIFYWFSVMTIGSEDTGGTGSWGMLFYLSVILVTFFGIDVLKIFGAKGLRPLVTPKLLIGLNRLLGIVFVVFGIVFIVQGILMKIQ